MIWFILGHILITLFLIISILGATNLYQIKTGIDFFLTMAIGLCFIVGAVKLCLVSLPYFIFFGLIISVLIGLVSFLNKTNMIYGLLLCVISFVFWPEMVCFAIFALQHLDEYRNNSGK